MITAISLPPRKTLALLGLASTVVAVAFWGLLGGGSAAAQDTPTATATRENLVVTVGGVGRIVQAKAARPIATPAPGGPSAAGSGSATPSEAPPDAVFPGAAGRVSKFLVKQGELVIAGQALVVLDDGGAAVTAVRQAQNDLATAEVELRQKQTSDPLKGTRASPDELAAGRYAVTAALRGLGKLLSAPRAADASTAWLEVRKAEAELETLIGGTPAQRAEATRIAQQNVELAEAQLARTLAPADPADVSAAAAELRKAESELALLLRPPDTPLPEEIAAAQRAVTVAREDLADAEAAVPQDPVAIRAAQLALDRALAEFAVLQKPPKGPLPEEVTSARQAVEAARTKHQKLLGPPNPAEVRLARAELERARAEFRKLELGPGKAALAAARQSVDTARTKLAQLLGPPLRADVAMSRLDLARAQAELSVLEARGGPASTDDVSLAQLRVDAARIRLALARISWRLLTVRAPTAGTVTGLLTARGAPVDTTTPILTVADLDQLAASVELSEFDVAKVRRGLKATVSVDALGGETIQGVVLFAAPTGADNGGVVTFPVRVGLSKGASLRPGMNVSVRIFVARKNEVLQVPLEAVSRDEDPPTVTVIDDSGEEADREVELGLANNKSVQIVKGLRAGEQVVLPEVAPSEEEEEEE